jgi:hypothetical protein
MQIPKHIDITAKQPTEDAPSKTTKSYSLDHATAELIARYLEDNKLELAKKNVFTLANLLRSAVLDYLNEYFEKHPEVLEEYIAARQSKRQA